MCFHGVPSHNFTFFHHSYTCGTDWPLTCLTGSMGPALSGLSPCSAFSFILCRIGACSGIGCQLAKINAVWQVLFRFWLAKLYHLRQVCVCLRVRLHAYNYLIGVIHKTSGSHAKHVWFTRIHAADLGQQLPAKQQIVNFQFFSDQNCPANRAQKSAISTQKPANGRKSGFLPWCVLTKCVLTKCILSQQS